MNVKLNLFTLVNTTQHKKHAYINIVSIKVHSSRRESRKSGRIGAKSTE